MKKNLFILTMLLCIAVIPEAYAYNFQSGGIYYDITGTSPNTVAVTYATGSYNSYSGNVVIPSSVTYNGTTYTVTGIGDNAFRQSGNLTGVTIPETVTSIGSKAFYQCGNLPSVTIPNGVVTIGESAFEKCYILTTVSIPSSVKIIANRVFAQSGLYTLYYSADSCSFEFEYSDHSCFSSCNYFRHLVIGDNVQVIPDYAFYGCNKLDSIFLPNSVSKIGNGAFNNCSNLSYISLSQSLETVGNNAFGGCSSLISISIPASVFNIGEGVFSRCTSLQSLSVAEDNLTYDSRNNCNAVIHTASNTLLAGCKNTIIPNTIMTIGNYAFGGCSGLTGYLNIPSSVKVIGSSAFGSCTGLSGILTIPDSVRIIGAYAFSYCTGINALTIGKSVDSIGNGAFSNCSSLTAVTFNADSCTQMGDNHYPEYRVFYQCGSLSSLTIGNNVKAIPSIAFQGCSSLTGMLIIPNSVRTIGHYAFNGCMGLTSSLILPDSLTYIGYGAFSGCNGLTGELTIPKYMSFIGNSAFSGCGGLSSIIFNADSCTSDVNGSTYILSNIFNDCEGVVSIQIGNDVKFLTDRLFMGISNADTIAIPRSVVRIGGSVFPSCINTVLFNADSCIIMSGTSYNGGLSTAFASNSNLTTLIIGNNVKYIPSHAFQGCSHLTGELIIPDSVSIIGQYAFSGCSSLDTLVISESVNTIKQHSFSGCSGLKSLYFSKVDTIEAFAFSNCSGLESLDLDGIKYIGNSAFGGCSGLTGVLNIPNTVVTIGQYAFEECSGIDTLVIGEGIVTIGDWAFEDCRSLTSIIFNADSCLNMYSGIFSGDTNVTSLMIGDNVKIIPNNAFRIYKLSGKLVIPDSVILIGQYAFRGCSRIDTVIIGKGVKSIYDNAFDYCNSLTILFFNADSCVSMSSTNSVFANCTNLTSLIIGDNVKFIPQSAFRNCSHLSGTLIIPDSISKIDYQTFMGCSEIDTLIIGKRVHTIGIDAFKNCSSITSITSYNEVPPALVFYNSTHPFYNVNRNTPVYVSCGSAQAYRNAWRYSSSSSSSSYFYNIYETIQPYIFTILSEDTLKGTVQVTIQPSCTETPVFEATPNFFYVFDHWSDGNTDNPRSIELTQDTTLVAHFREYAFTIDCDTAHGHVVVLQTPTVENPQAIVEAVVTDSCYVFAGWSNGTTENLLTITVTQDTLFTAIFNPVVNLQITAPSTVCHGDSVTFATTGTDSYLWFNGDTTSVISLLPENSLEVSVTGTDSDGCSASATHFVNVLPRPELTISGMTDICEGASTILTATSANPTEELVLFEDFENGLDNWYTWDRDGDGYNWYSTLENDNQSGYESNGAAASTSWNNIVFSPDNMLYRPVHIPNTGAQLSWYAAAHDPNWPAEHYDVNIFVQNGSYWVYHSIFSETLSDGQWVHRTLDLSEWAGLDVMIGFEHHNCSDQYALKIDNVRFVTFVEDTYVWSNGHAGNQLSVNNAGTYYVTATKPNGCTSSDSVTITVWQPDTVDITVNSPENYYVINDETFCTSGDYMQTLQNIHGCDSVINLHLTLAPRDTVFVTDTVCGGWHEIYWEDSSYDTTYIVYFDNAYDESVYSIAEYGGWGDAIVASDGLIYEFYVSGEYYRNDSLWIQYDETRTFEAVSGCDSVVKKHHYVKFSDWYSLRDTACGSYVWQGDTITANPNNLNRWLYAESTNAQGCYSSVELRLTLLPAIEESVTITACDSYIWNGTTYTESGVYTYNTDTTLQETPACKLTTLYLTINSSITESFEATACDSYTWNDSIYTTSGEYVQTFTAANGCDSTVTLQLTINESKHTDTTAESCGSYTWNETTYTTTGEYTQTFTAANGCDSTVTLQLTILPLPTPNITGITTVCEGQTATLNATGGVSYLWEDGTTTNTYPATTSGLYTVTVTNAEGCSATASTTVTVNPLPEVAITGNTAICPGGSTVLTATGADSYQWSNGSTNPSIPVNMFGQYSVIGTSSAGCFSTASVTVLVSQPPVITISGNTDICAGESTTLTANGGVSYMWSNGSTADTLVATTAGNWQVIGYNADGCSNMASVTVNVWQPASSDLYITAFDSCYMWFGTPRCESSNYTYTLQTIHGCDSVITLHLTLEDAITTEFNATSCDSYTWNGITYSQSGNYTQNFTAANGNDSIVTLHLTINSSVTELVEVTVCDSYEWNGQTYTSSGDYTQTFTAANGCDSVVTLHLTVNSSVTEFVEATACDSYLWNDSSYTVSGDYTKTFTAANGCDSTVTLHLTINHPVTELVEATACDSYGWNGQTYTQSGDYVQTFTAANGCDSVVTLHLTVNDTKHVEFADSTCTAYTWNGQTYASSGNYTQTLTAANGCDSVVTLHLTIVPTITPAIAVTGSLTACDDGSATLSVPGNYNNFVWSTGALTPTITVSEAGYYWVTATDAYGCEGVSEMVQLGGSTQIDETPAICMVDVEDSHNLLIWEELSDPDVASYHIYRENNQANVFEPLAVIPAGSVNAFADSTADPSVRAWRYKITAADTCGGETPMSGYHKTVHLTINQGLGNSWNLIWTPYEGLEFASYKLYRGTANNNLQLIQTMPATLTSYTDNNPSGDALFYQIEVVMTEGCVQQTRDITHTGARSNIVYNQVPVMAEETVSACESYDWNGQTTTSSGDYTQTFVSELGYDSVVTLHLTIHHTPVFSISGNLAISQGQSTALSVPNNAGWSYLWNTGETASVIIVTPSETTSYSVTVTEGTCNASDSVTVTVNTGINGHEFGDLTVYPNPTNDIVNVQCTMNNVQVGTMEFHVFDAYGKLGDVVETRCTTSLQTAQIDLSGLASGVYFVKAVADGNVVAIRKVVKR